MGLFDYVVILCHEHVKDSGISGFLNDIREYAKGIALEKYRPRPKAVDSLLNKVAIMNNCSPTSRRMDN